MTTNPYSNFHNSQLDQLLLDKLIIESIQWAGIDVLYLPRKNVDLDKIFGEDILNYFSDNYEIEVYVQNIDGFAGDGEFIKKFGLEIRDQCTLIISRTRFSEVFGDEYVRPREGDLIWDPMTQSLYQIHYVSKEKMFYQLGSLNTWELKVEKFVYSHENIRTDIPAVDSLEEESTYQVEFTMGAGTGNYSEGETAYQGASLASATATGVVLSWSSPILTLKEMTGEFLLATAIKGNTSSASRLLSSFDRNELPNDPVADNQQIDTEADTYLEFDLDNPFKD